MSGLLQWLMAFTLLRPILRPGVRLVVGAIAVPLFRVALRRVARIDQLNNELTKDLEQWFRGSLLLLVATENMEHFLFGEVFKFGLAGDWSWVPLAMRIMLAIGVVETMPDQALFSVIYPGPARLLFPKGRRIQALREQLWPFIKGMVYRHLDRSSAVLAIIAAIKGGWVGWMCYGLSIFQFLLIGLMCSKEKAIDVLNEFDKQMNLRREQLAHDIDPDFVEPDSVTSPSPEPQPATADKGPEQTPPAVN